VTRHKPVPVQDAGDEVVFGDPAWKKRLAAITISHDLTLIRSICACTLLMYLGRVVEAGPTTDLIERPLHHRNRRFAPDRPKPARRLPSWR